jgi:hypothetical protein
MVGGTRCVGWENNSDAQAMCDAYSLIGPTRDFSKPFTASGNEQSRDIFPPPASELIPL